MDSLEIPKIILYMDVLEIPKIMLYTDVLEIPEIMLYTDILELTEIMLIHTIMPIQYTRTGKKYTMEQIFSPTGEKYIKKTSKI